MFYYSAVRRSKLAVRIIRWISTTTQNHFALWALTNEAVVWHKLVIGYLH